MTGSRLQTKHAGHSPRGQRPPIRGSQLDVTRANFAGRDMAPVTRSAVRPGACPEWVIFCAIRVARRESP